MEKRGMSRREFFAEGSLRLSGASLLLSQYCLKPAFASQEAPARERIKEPIMEYRTLGKTGLKVSVMVSIGLSRP